MIKTKKLDRRTFYKCYIKRFIIVPLLVISITSCTIYVDYQKPEEVKASVTVAALGWLLTALALLGFGISSLGNAENAISNFSQFLADCLPDDWEKNLGKLLTINGVQIHTYKIKAWYDMCTSPEVVEAAGGINAYIEQLKQRAQLSLEDLVGGTAINQPIVTGSFSALAYAADGWLDKLKADNPDLTEWDDMAIGDVNSLPGVMIEDTALYQVLTDQTILDFIYNRFSQPSYLIDFFNTFLSSEFATEIASYISTCNSTYIVRIYQSTGIYSVSVLDIPDNCVAFDHTGNYYKFLLSDGTLEYMKGRKYTSGNDYTNGTKVNLGPNAYYGYLNNIMFAIGTQYELYIPIGISDDPTASNYMPINGIDNIDRCYKPLISMTDIDDIYVDDVLGKVPFDIEKTNEGTDIKDIPIDISDEQVIPIPGDVAIDNAAIGDSQVIQDMIDEAIDMDIPDEDVDDKDIAIPDTAPVEDDVKYKYKLAAFFPFCIPFDIYNFFTILAAEPEAPKFTWKFPSINEKGELIYEEYTFDLSMFDDVAFLMRKMFLLMFCVGLAMATNKLIKH